jgi:hypothetical protein
MEKWRQTLRFRPQHNFLFRQLGLMYSAYGAAAQTYCSTQSLAGLLMIQDEPTCGLQYSPVVVLLLLSARRNKKPC